MNEPFSNNGMSCIGITDSSESKYVDEGAAGKKL